MAYRRRRRSKKYSRRYSRHKYPMRGSGYRGVYGIARNHIHNFKRTVSYTPVTVSAGNISHNATYFALSLLPNSSEFTTLFDQYRIRAVKIWFVYNKNVNSTYQNPNIYSVLDYDDATTLTQESEYLQYETYRMTRGTTIHKRYLKPRVAAAAYNGSFTGYMQADRNQWIDVASPSVQYYGVKYAIDGTPDGSTVGTIMGAFRIYATYYFQCKSVR